MAKRWSLAPLALAMLGSAMLAACSQAGTEGAQLDAGQTLKIDHAIWRQYEDYVAEGRGLGPKRYGAFVVAVAGDTGLAGLGTWYYCPKTYDGCVTRGGENVVTRVLDVCRRENLDCLLFARNEDVQVPYEVTD